MTFLEHSFSDRVVLLMLAMLINLLFGGPRWLHHLLHIDAPGNSARRILSFFTYRMNRSHRGESTRRMRGIILTIIAIACAFLIGVCVSLLSIQTRSWMIAEVAMLTVLLSIRQSLDLTLDVKKFLVGNQLAEAKTLLQPHVQKDLTNVDTHGVARATIEYLAHRLISGVISPGFWYLLGGLALALPALASHCLAFIAVRPTPKYAAFGSFIAAIDRIFRSLPAAITVILMLLVMPLVPGAKPGKTKNGLMAEVPSAPLIADFRVLAMTAYAFDIALLGPCAMYEYPVAYPWIGTGSARLGAQDITRMQFLFAYAGGVALLLVAVLSLLV